MKKAILILLLVPVFVFSAYDILLTAPDVEGYQTDMHTALTGFTGDFDSVVWWNMYPSNQPVLADIQGYDAVVTWSNYGYPDNNAWGDTLADYVDGGGVVVACTFGYYVSGYVIGGDFVTSDYSPLLSEGNNYVTNYDLELSSPDMPGHPILDSVSSLNCGYIDYVSLAGWGNLVTHWQTINEEAVAYNDNMNIVSITAYPGQAGSVYDWTGDYPQLIRNAIVWMIGQQNTIQSTSLGNIKTMFE